MEGSYTFSGTLQDAERNDHAVSGAATVTVSSVDPLVARYDTNNNGTIDQAEVEEALYDYFFLQTISQADMEEVLFLYFFL